jgi:hypothetical protein
MMTDHELRAWAEAEYDRLEAQRREAEIANLIGQRRHAEQCRADHERICKKHGLNPATTSELMKARAERAYSDAWTSHVVAGSSSGSRALHILDPHGSGIEDKATISQLLATQAKMRKAFEASWPPGDLASRIAEGVVGAVEQAQSHTEVRAA